MPKAPATSKSKKPTATKGKNVPKDKAPVKPAQPAGAQGREVVYPEPEATLCDGEDALCAANARALLGWEAEPEGAKWGSNYLLKDTRGNKIRCHNNVTNRPLYRGNLQRLIQEILRRRWNYNAETIIIGLTGLVLNGQHQLIALVLATQIWEDHKEQWADYWPTVPTIEKLVAFGVSEDDATVNTMDTCKPRTFADVVYRSEHFRKTNARDRRKLAIICGYCVRLLWERTGTGLDAHAILRTHAEGLDFIAHHPRLLECVRHIFEEDGAEGKLSKHWYITPGYAAAMLYLMGSSASDPSAYRHERNEHVLDWAHWDKACNFFVVLASGGKETKPLRAAMAEVSERGPIPAEVQSVLALAWTQYVAGKPFTTAGCTPDYTPDPDNDGVLVLVEHPTVGGIDHGPARTQVAEEAPQPTEEQISQRAATQRRKRATPKDTMKGKRHGEHWAKGDEAWAREKDGDHFFGTLVCDPYWAEATVEAPPRLLVLVQVGENQWEVAVDDLSLAKPKD